jgi:hypothetical protein
MREVLIDHINKFLTNNSDWFLSEAEIQIKLAQYLYCSKYYDNIFVEYCIESHKSRVNPWFKNKKNYIDIVVRKGKNYIPIEIKFRTSKQKLERQVFGSSQKYELAEQKAHNEGCYIFWKDVKRIELLKERYCLKYSGVVLFITNDVRYSKMPKSGVQYYHFSIHEGRKVKKGAKLFWSKKGGKLNYKRAKNFPEFTLSKNYSIIWQNMNIPNHRYVLV